ncbi:MAG: hypothetical protein H8E36_15010 [Rhodospirillaceae bacterium]|nr:hypothetical protein [Rhodospirillaceae bacterium]MBL6942020.1 hypothetical protein [Rhodospirillales bacterium]
MCCGDAVMALRGFETIVGPSPSTGWLAGAIAPLAERNKRHLAGFTGV